MSFRTAPYNIPSVGFWTFLSLYSLLTEETSPGMHLSAWQVKKSRAEDAEVGEGKGVVLSFSNEILRWQRVRSSLQSYMVSLLLRATWETSDSSFNPVLLYSFLYTLYIPILSPTVSLKCQRTITKNVQKYPYLQHCCHLLNSVIDDGMKSRQSKAWKWKEIQRFDTYLPKK